MKSLGFFFLFKIQEIQMQEHFVAQILFEESF